MLKKESGVGKKGTFQQTGKSVGKTKGNSINGDKVASPKQTPNRIKKVKKGYGGESDSKRRKGSIRQHQKGGWVDWEPVENCKPPPAWE